MSEDFDLANAFRAVKDEYDGTSPEADLTLQRALFASRLRVRRRRLTQWILVPLAAALVASTAWAGVTGRLAPVMHTVTDAFHAETPPPIAVPPPAPPPMPIVAAKPAEPVVPAPEPTPAPVEEPAAAPAPPPPVAPPPAAAVASAPAIVPDREGQLFAEANRIHFVERDPARALAAWDRYLQAAPTGALAPEARYNRALALVRLGRTVEAKWELEKFASGSYRRVEAQALLDAIARDAGAN